LGHDFVSLVELRACLKATLFVEMTFDPKHFNLFKTVTLQGKKESPENSIA